jgi:predicted RNA-binding Zn ribbon-like protein
MATVRQAADPVEVAVGLLNTWDTYADPPELLREADVLRRLLRHFGYEEAAAKVAASHVDWARNLRDRLRGAFEASSENEAVATLNEVLGETDARPRLVRSGREWRFQYGPPPDEGPEFLAPLAATALLEAIRRDGWERFGICAAGPCTCVYVDRSRNRSRRYCCQLCADRMSQAAYRARKRGRR